LAREPPNGLSPMSRQRRLRAGTFGDRREAIVAIATTLRAQHLQLQEALQELRASSESDPTQKDLLALLEAKGCGFLVTVTSAIQATDCLLAILPPPSESR
jgi:hypothetical protein